MSSFIILFIGLWIYPFLCFGLVYLVQSWSANCVLWLFSPVKVTSRLIPLFLCYSVPYILSVGVYLNFCIYNWIRFFGFFVYFTSIGRLFLLDLNWNLYLEHFDILFVSSCSVIHVKSWFLVCSVLYSIYCLHCGCITIVSCISGSICLVNLEICISLIVMYTFKIVKFGVGDFCGF